MAESRESVKTIFGKALEIRSEEEWARYLDQACAEDDSLRDEIEDLLGAIGRAGEFLIGSPPPSPTVDQPITETPGTQIGPYKLLQQLGEGGMGVVYMAEQKEPVKRRVALKIIKPGMDTRQVIARFEAERQALAMMDHPNIARVLDAGQTESGRPYFVMELVKGMPVTNYCDEQHLTPKERLELFVPICQAVQHAHQKGIIHRDLKPSNILVALYDGRAVPKIIDFGVAKATSQTLTEKTMFTQVGQVVGTLEYMSPEQAERNQLDIDTRSDIYSLGVVLYELLTGETPFDRARLRSAAFDEMLRIIREEEPSKPSTKVSSSESLPSIAANRRIEPAKLGSIIRGELDWIVLKAMEKDRGRRYETASKFAEDVQHYLNDEAVVACPPSRAYRFRKFVRRNTVTISVTSAIATLLIVGTVISTALAISRAVARDEALLAKREAEQSEQKARESEHLAKRKEQEATQSGNAAVAVLSFLMDHVLSAARPRGEDGGLGPDATIRAALDAAEPEIADEFDAHPLMEAWVRHCMGNTYLHLGEYEKAIRQMQRSAKLRQDRLGGEDEATLNSLHLLGEALRRQGHFEKAREIHRDTVTVRERVLGPAHDDTLESKTGLALTVGDAGDDAACEAILREVLRVREEELGRQHPLTMNSAYLLASRILQQGRYPQAESLLRDNLELRRDILGPKHPDTLETMNALGALMAKEQRQSEAETLLREVVRFRQSVPGPEHPATLDSTHNLADVVRLRGEYSEAETLNQTVLEVRLRDLGREHPDTLKSMNNLALCVASQQRWGEAEGLFRDLDGLSSRVFGAGHPISLGVTSNLALILENQGRYAEAEPLYRAACEIARSQLGSEHPVLLKLAGNLSRVLRRNGQQALENDDFENAIELFRKAIEWRQISAGSREHWIWLELARCYLETGEYDQARDALERAIALRQDSGPTLAGGPRWWYYVIALWHTGEKEKARSYFAELTGLLGEAKLPPEGLELHRRGRDEAETLLNTPEDASVKDRCLNSE